ncbi:hypothetical protein HDU96_006514 [Phlyctochytrium bullatum]|nr:hypothetical protein HDU96_006514 [Phlyctochytrium bullatum]
MPPWTSVASNSSTSNANNLNLTSSATALEESTPVPSDLGIILIPQGVEVAPTATGSTASISPLSSKRNVLPSTALPPPSSDISSLSSKIAAVAASQNAPSARVNTGAGLGVVNRTSSLRKSGAVSTDVDASEDTPGIEAPVKSNLRSTSAPSSREKRITFAPGTIDPSPSKASSINRSTPSVRASSSLQPTPRNTFTPTQSRTVRPTPLPATNNKLPAVSAAAANRNPPSATAAASKAAASTTAATTTATTAPASTDPTPPPVTAPNPLYSSYTSSYSTSEPADQSSSSTSSSGGYQISIHHIQHLQKLEATIADQAKRIEDLEHQLKEAERREQDAIKDRAQVTKELEQLKKYMATDYKTVEQLKSQLQEEHTTNASLIIFNRSLKTQLAEMEVIIENLMQAKGGTAAQIAQAAMARLELESMKSAPPPKVKK